MTFFDHRKRRSRFSEPSLSLFLIAAVSNPLGMASCDYSWEFPYYLYIACVVIIQSAFLLLFVHTMARVDFKNDKEWWQKKGLYLAMQVVALLWIMNYTVRNILDPHLNIIRGNIWCQILPHFSIFLPAMFYCLYLHQILNRLVLSFHDSMFELSSRTIAILRALILFIPITSTAMLLEENDVVCVGSWSAPDLHQSLSVCSIASDNFVITQYYIVHGFVLLIIALNIILGVMFTAKLTKLVAMTKQIHSADSAKHLKFEALIKKNNLLTVIGWIYTTIGFAVYRVLHVGLPVVVDCLVNVILVGLMLKRNEWYYKRLCAPCIAMGVFRAGNKPNRTSKVADAPNVELPASVSPTHVHVDSDSVNCDGEVVGSGISIENGIQ